MINYYKTIRQLALAGVLSSFTMQSMAQADAGQLIKAGTEDANALFNAYLSPVMKSFGAGLNSGWYQTAKPHGIGGFDITISTNVTFAPTEDQNFDVNQLGLKKVELKAGENPNAPTIFGASKNGPAVEVIDKSPITGGDTAITSFSLPQGIGVNLFAVPTAQFSVGVGLGTDISVRFMPSISAGDIGVGLFGFAIKHDIKQWIPGMKELPFDLSGMFGYTTANAKLKFSGNSAVTPEKDGNGNDVSYIDYSTASNNYNDQKVEFKAKAWTANVIVSKKLGPLTPYLGLGYQSSTTDLSVLGNYPITVPKDAQEYQSYVLAGGDPNKYAKIMDVKDPVKITGELNGFRANVGFRLKLAILTIHGDYTFAAYNVASVGLGINLQSIVPFKM